MSIITAYKLISNYFWPENVIEPEIRVVGKIDNMFFNNYECENFNIEKIRTLVDELKDISPIYKTKLYRVIDYYQEQHIKDPYRYFLDQVDSLIFFVNSLPLLQITFQNNKRNKDVEGRYYVSVIDISKI